MPATRCTASCCNTLKEIVPGLATVGLLTEPSGYDADRAAHESAARRLGLRLEVEEIRGNDGIGDAFASTVRRRVDGFTIIGGSLIYSGRQQIADLALQHRVPGIHFLHDYARAGLLASYGPSLFDMYRRSAGYVDKIYKGAKPADLPVEQPSKFELVINLKTAKAPGTAFVWNPFRLELQRLGSSEGHHIADRRALLRGIGARRFLRRDRCTQSGGTRFRFAPAR